MAVSDAVKAWRLTAPMRQLDTQVSQMGVRKTGLDVAFVDPAQASALVSSLRKADPDKRRHAPQAFAATAALDVVRPELHLGVNVRNRLEEISRQLFSIQVATANPKVGIMKALEGANLAFKGKFKAPFAEMSQALERLIEEQRAIDERTDEFVQRHGWPIPWTLPEVSYRKIAALASRPRREVDRVMVDLFSPGRLFYQSARSVLDDSPYFQPRRPLLRQVWRAQRNGEWYLVINGLLPLVEGVLVDAMFPSGTRPKSVKRASGKLAEIDSGEVGPVSAAETILFGAGSGTALFDSYEPPPGIEPRSLNRNAVLHGIARRYGTQKNATKLFMLLVLMAECFDLRDDNKSKDAAYHRA
jgi:hypothetical protein